MNTKEIALKTKKSKRYIHYILNGERQASPALARQLEEITGIDRRAWLWPKEFYNPFIKIQALEKSQPGHPADERPN